MSILDIINKQNPIESLDLNEIVRNSIQIVNNKSENKVNIEELMFDINNVSDIRNFVIGKKELEERYKNEINFNLYKTRISKTNKKINQELEEKEKIQQEEKERKATLIKIQEENTKLDETIRYDSPYYERYYCGADVQIWVDNQWFDNVASFQYALTNNKSPVYGYFSENFDAVARGTRLVQGQIGVALTDIQEFNKKCLKGIKYIDKNAYTTVNKYDKYIGVGFTIGIYLGDSIPEKGNISKHRSGTYLKIKDCHITNHALYCDTSENPLMIVYNFFARDYDPDLENLDEIYYNPYDLTEYVNEYGNVNKSTYNKNTDKIAQEIKNKK